jgi:hypothetical protein
MTNMPWTFVVVFMTIAVVILTFAAIWVMSHGSGHRHT